MRGFVYIQKQDLHTFFCKQPLTLILCLNQSIIYYHFKIHQVFYFHLFARMFAIK